KAACKNKEFDIGNVLVVKENTIGGEKHIVNFPTKKHWRGKSKYEFIEIGLKALVEAIAEYDIKSIAIPPLGCGYGGLQWQNVKELIEKYLCDLKDIEVVVYMPNEEVKALLKNQEKQKQVKLTPARAMLLYALFYYETLDENSNIFVANKLAYFFQRLGVSDFNRLNFKAHYYGPYSEQVVHVLHYLNGAYLKGLEQMSVKPFETIELIYENLDELSDYIHKELGSERLQKLKNLMRLVNGFQSPLSLEILASVDYILKDQPNANLEFITQEIQKWNPCKKRLFKKEYIQIAYKHLMDYRDGLHNTK
ncbi:MAG: type II toxin-antitoxin system antitoxin DNA ADP-ribosyl glycohydrolase DarG, partial [Chitinophagales bacterium]